MGVCLTSPLLPHARLAVARHAIPRHIVAPREKHPTSESFFLDDRAGERYIYIYICICVYIYTRRRDKLREEQTKEGENVREQPVCSRARNAFHGV